MFNIHLGITIENHHSEQICIGNQNESHCTFDKDIIKKKANYFS